MRPMSRHFLILTLVVGLLGVTTLAGAGDIPKSLNDIELGGVVAKMKKQVKLRRPKPMKGAPWLYRLSIVPNAVYSGGYVLIGTCAAPGRVLRIKLYYRDGTLEGFRKISGELLKQYGDPTEYKGEFDGHTMGNKWSFTDANTKPISLILQRTESEDPEVGYGNTIKLTNWGMLEAERACWQERSGTHAATHACPVTQPAACY